MKIEKMKTNCTKMFLIIAFVIILSSNINAFAVGFESTSLNLYPGEEHESAFSLQNYGAEAGDITVEAVIEEGGEYITFIDGNKFDVGANNNAAAPVRINIPDNARAGDRLNIKILFKVISGDMGGQGIGGDDTTVGFAFSYRRVI